MKETAFKTVFGREGITADDIRHWFQTDFVEHYTEYNDAQRKEIFERLGDTPAQLPSALRYMLQKAENAGKTYTEIAEGVEGKIEAKDLAERDAEEEGSVGDINEKDKIDEIAEEGEVISPITPIYDDKEAIYKRLAELEVEKTKLMVMLMKK